MNKTISLTLYFLLAATFILRLPTIRENMNSQGSQFEIQKLYNVTNKTLMPISFPASNRKSVAIFWASWCVPCKIELNRISKAIEEKEFSAENIYAISMDEKESELFKAIEERNYKFKIYYDKDQIISIKQKISSTPTVVFIDENGKIKWQTTGVSPMLINKIKIFLN